MLPAFGFLRNDLTRDGFPGKPGNSRYFSIDFQAGFLYRKARKKRSKFIWHKEVMQMVNPRIARVSEIVAGSPKSFDDAIQIGFSRAAKTLRGITGLRITEQRVAVEDAKIVEYRVRMEVIFVLET